MSIYIISRAFIIYHISGFIGTIKTILGGMN